MYDLGVRKWLCSKACKSEFDYLWHNISDSQDMENILLPLTILVTTN